MAARSDGTPSTKGGTPKLLSIRFNQSNSCIAVGTTAGYRIYACHPFSKCFESNDGGMAIVEMLFNTSLITLVGAGEQASLSPRTVRMFNTKNSKYICELNFVSTVLNIRINKARMIAVLESKIHLFELKTMKVLHALDTPPNPSGMVALSPSVVNCFLAFPARNDKGHVLIYDALNLQALHMIRAHDSPVRIMAFNPEGTMLATTSDKGTVIRVFSLPTGKKLFTFRRGSYPAMVNSLSFNSTSSLLCLSSSDSSTIHVFALTPENSEEQRAKLKSKKPSAFQRFLPTALTEYVEPGRNFAHISLRGGVNASGCGFYDKSTVMVLANGQYFRYSVPDEGGVCKLEEEHSLTDHDDAIGVKLHGGLTDLDVEISDMTDSKRSGAAPLIRIDDTRNGSVGNGETKRLVTTGTSPTMMATSSTNTSPSSSNNGDHITAAGSPPIASPHAATASPAVASSPTLSASSPNGGPSAATIAAIAALEPVMVTTTAPSPAHHHTSTPVVTVTAPAAAAPSTVSSSSNGAATNGNGTSGRSGKKKKKKSANNSANNSPFFGATPAPAQPPPLPMDDEVPPVVTTARAPGVIPTSLSSTSISLSSPSSSSTVPSSSSSSPSVRPTVVPPRGSPPASPYLQPSPPSVPPPPLPVKIGSISTSSSSSSGNGAAIVGSPTSPSSPPGTRRVVHRDKHSDSASVVTSTRRAMSVTPKVTAPVSSSSRVPSSSPTNLAPPTLDEDDT